MPETVDTIVVTGPAPAPASPRAQAVAQSLVEHAAGYESTGASMEDIAAGFWLASCRLAAWAQHRDWDRLRHDRDAVDDLAA